MKCAPWSVSRFVVASSKDPPPLSGVLQKLGGAQRSHHPMVLGYAIGYDAAVGRKL